MAHHINARAKLCLRKGANMQLSDHPETRRENRRRLINWGRWGDLCSVESKGIPKGDAIFREYRPEAGDTWDGDPKPDPIDHDDAEKAEAIIKAMLETDFYARQVLIMNYYRRMTAHEIADFFSKRIGAANWTERKVRDTLYRGEQIFWEMSRNR